MNGKEMIILELLWRAYCRVAAAIIVLEGIGLDISGDCNPDENGSARADSGNMSVLFGALGTAEDAILACFGIYPDTNQFDEACMVLADISDEERGSETMPERIASELQRIADTVSNSQSDDQPNSIPEPETDDNLDTFDVTIAMTGGITVKASDETDAMQQVYGMSTSLIMAQAHWNDPVPADVEKIE